MFNIENFTNRECILKIFKISNITNEEDILNILEMYKFLSNKEIVSVLCNIGYNINCYNPKEHIDEFSLLEDKYDVLIFKTSEKSCDIVCNYYSEISQDSLELSLLKFKCNLVKVTPYNFLYLRNKFRGVDIGLTINYGILLKRLILDCMDSGGTDLSFVVEHINMVPDYRYYYRIGNVYELQHLFKFDREMNSDFIHKLIHFESSTNVSDLETIQGVTTCVSDVFEDGTTSLRVSANKCLEGYMYTFRIQNLKSTSLTIEQLGFLGYQNKILERDSKRPFGITFITGAIRSGKNTTAFAMANNIVNLGVKIVDYSNPTECLMPFSQVDYQGSENYLRSGMRLLKKHDVNYVFLNEIPSKEVAFAVQDLVNTSIHVITTLHVNRVWHMPYKLYEYYGEEYKNVISQINCIVNQKMFSKCCPHCLNNVVSSYFEDPRIHNFLDKYGVSTLKINEGCEHCDNGSLKGTNSPVCEILELNDELRHDLLKCKYPYEMEDVIRGYMMDNKLAMEFTIADKLRKGDIYISALDSIL